MIRPVVPSYEGGVIPRLSINHNEGTFTFNDGVLSREQLDNIIMLGLVRQRSFWQMEGAVTVCKSYDFEHGIPGPQFPWNESNFDEPLEVAGTALPCGSCIFKDFVADPMSPRGSRQPPCREQFVVPLLVPGEVSSREVTGTVMGYRLGVATFQKSALKPTKDYMTWFKREGQPLYSHTTSLAAEINIGRGFKFSVPTFERNQSVDPRAYRAMSSLLASARDTLVTPAAPKRASTGGMLSVSVDAEPATPGYSGSFFA